MTDQTSAAPNVSTFHFEVTSVVPTSADPTRLPSEVAADLQQHGKLGDAWKVLTGRAVVAVPAEKVLSTWEVRVEQMRELVSRSLTAMPGDLGLESVSFSLGFSVEAGFWVFAKAGAEASVEVTFKRKS